MRVGQASDQTARHDVVRRAAWLAAALAGMALLVSGCGGASGSGASGGAVTARSLPHVGTVLADSKGYALYMFVPDARKRVTCTAVCASAWPPLMAPSGHKASVGTGVKSSLIGSDPDPSGGRVVTYGGWPLYTYIGDNSPGEATGQAVNQDGGEWYVMLPSGKPLISSAAG